MELYPALDIRGGTVVRAPGDPDPVEVARAYVDAGASWIHVVDLDAVFGTGDNLDAVCDVCRLAGVKVQVGGNLADPDRVESVVSAGARRVVFGTEPALDVASLAVLQQAAGEAATAVALEVCDRRLYLRSTGQTLDHPLEQFVQIIRDRGVSTVVYRDVTRDGSLAGADFHNVVPVIGKGVDLMYAGGVESLQEIRDARNVGLGGIIVGRAFHERRFTVVEALACLD